MPSVVAFGYECFRNVTCARRAGESEGPPMNRGIRVSGGFALLAAVAIVACANGNNDDTEDPIVGADAATDAPLKHDAAKDAGDSGRSSDTGGGQGDPDATPSSEVDASDDAPIDPIDATTPVDA